MDTSSKPIWRKVRATVWNTLTATWLTHDRKAALAIAKEDHKTVDRDCIQCSFDGGATWHFVPNPLTLKVEADLTEKVTGEVWGDEE